MKTSQQLDATNAEHILYKRPPLEIVILGGIKLDGLDRLRTTLKIQVEHLAIRHNLDLYNDNQLEKLTRKSSALCLSMGCQRIPYNQEEEITPFLGVWKGERYKKSSFYFEGCLAKKGVGLKKCNHYYPLWTYQ